MGPDIPTLRFRRATGDEQTALATPLDRFQIGVRQIIDEQQVEQNDSIATRYLSDDAFRNVALPALAPAIHDAIRAAAAAGTSE